MCGSVHVPSGTGNNGQLLLLPLLVLLFVACRFHFEHLVETAGELLGNPSLARLGEACGGGEADGGRFGLHGFVLLRVFYGSDTTTVHRRGISKSTAVKSVLATRPGFRQKYQESVLTSFPRRECVRSATTDRPFCPPPAALLIAMRMMRSQQAPSNENDVPHMCKCRHASAETDRGIDHRYKLTVRQVMHLDLLGKESIHPLKSG